ncbi:hypothetical protein EAE96_005319 [Botrytis aclada]|nr:hypothetical protein EAE96_005319 [Botrytis aclada]
MENSLRVTQVMRLSTATPLLSDHSQKDDQSRCTPCSQEKNLTPRPTSSIRDLNAIEDVNESAGVIEPGESQIASLEELLRDCRRETSQQSRQYFIPICRQNSILTVEAIEDDIRKCDAAIPTDEARVCAQCAHHEGRKLYATLACMGRGADVRHLERQKITDKDLPLEYIRGDLSPETETRKKGGLFLKTGVKVEDIDHWKEKQLEEFFNTQWWTIAPVFKDKAELELTAMEVLPFLPFDGEDTDEMKTKQGAYSEVFPVNIHASHHKFWNSDQVKKKEQLVAVKKLFSTDEIEFKKERDVLKILGSKSPPHPHLIRLLATYRQKGKYHLIFPYAESNLRSYWEQRLLPKFDHGTVMWALAQMCGISNALFRLHEFKVTFPLNVGGAANVRVQMEDDGEISVRAGEEMFGRHGDIKPENILYFAEGPEAEDPRGVLKLADFGLGRFHGRDSKSGIRPSGILSSPTYEPPECKLRRPVSRAYDIWSCGCVWLEFITWLLKGNAGIDDAGLNDINDDNFFTIPRKSNSSSEATIRDGVILWVEGLHQHARCSKLIHDLLKLIMDDLLLIDADKRFKASDFHRKMKNYHQQARKDPDYMLKSAPLSPEDSKATLLEIPRHGRFGSHMTSSGQMSVNTSQNSSVSRNSRDLSPKSRKTVTWPSDLA